MSGEAAAPTVLVEASEGVARITLNRPQARNALDPAMIGQLAATLHALDADAAVRVVVLRGAGDRAFCAGADLKALFTDGSILEARQRYGDLAGVLQAIRRLRPPVIAQVHGYALAGGCGLAAACDLVVAAEDARFGLPEIRLGLLPLMVLAPILRVAAPRRVLEMMLTGAEVGADEALAMGLVSRVVPREALAETVERLARTIAGFSPATLAIGKEAFHRALDLDESRSLPALRDLLAVVARSEDAREGIAAFLERRPPRWTGR